MRKAKSVNIDLRRFKNLVGLSLKQADEYVHRGRCYEKTSG